MRTLYEELKNIDSEFAETRVGIESARFCLNNIVSSSCEIEYDPEAALEAWEAEKLAAKKAKIGEYSDNEFIQMAISGKQTLVESLHELYAPLKGYRLLLPKITNRKHNRIARAYEDLVENSISGKVYGIKINGPFRPNNPVSGALWIAAIFAYIMVLDPMTDFNPMVLAPSGALGALMGLIGSTPRTFDYGAEGQAKYLDAVIKEANFR